MPSSLPTVEEIARKSHSMVLRHLEKAGMQAALAKDVGVSESTISRWKNEALENECLYLAGMGFRVISSAHCVVSRRCLDSFIVMGKDRMESINDSYDLERMFL